MYSRKYHGKECGCRKLRLLVFMPQLDVAELETNENDKREKKTALEPINSQVK
jgi:hypothetical protein